MQSLRFLPLVLVLGLVSSCNKSDVDAAPGDATKSANDAMKSAGDAAKGAAQQAGAAMETLMKDLSADFSKLDTTKLQQLGKDAMAAVATQLGNIKDLASAQSVSSNVTPLIEKLEGLKKALGGMLPDTATVKSAISSLTTKFQNSEIMDAIKPMLTKLQNLVGA
jgi:hypothetical protein